MNLPPGHPLNDGRLADSAFLAAARGVRPDTLPVWFMRQAGRSLPEYRAARAGTAMLDACLRPELVAEITCQPVRRHGVDAAIFFSDIVVPLRLAGIDIDIVPSRGPVLADPIRTNDQVRTLPDPAGADFSLIEEAARACVAQLGATPLIGFAGAPFTLASYLVEGGPSRDQLRTRALMIGEPETWHALAAWTAELSRLFLAAQVRGGACAVQLFDSWVGNLSTADYAQFAAPHSAAILRGAAPSSVPRIHFGLGAGHLLPALLEAGADVVGIDHRLSLTAASQILGPSVPLQGNLDPAVLFVPRPERERRAAAMVADAAGAPAHIANLGHGVPPNADPAVLTDLVAYLHSLT